MSVVLALPKLFDDVVARMDAEAAAQMPPLTPVPHAFGWRARALRSGSLRIVWTPGDLNGAIGDLNPARNPGRNPRPLATLGELFTVDLEAANTAALEDERAQYQAARELFDAWWRAVYLEARGTVQVRSVAWVTDQLERRYGATVRVVASIQAMVSDTPLAIAPVDTRAVIDVEELDVTEQMESAPAA